MITDLDYRCELIVGKYLEDHILYFMLEYPEDKEEFGKALEKAVHNSIELIKKDLKKEKEVDKK